MKEKVPNYLIQDESQKTPKKKTSIVKRIFGILFTVIGVIVIMYAFDSGKSGGSTFGKVKNSQWDGSVEIAEDYLKKYLLKDPSSYESVDWSKVHKRSNGTYEVTHTFRARNGFGGMGMQTLTFVISSDGESVIEIIK